MKRKVALGVILVLLGLVSLWYSVVNHMWGYIESHSERTYQNAQLIDNNIVEIVNKYADTLDYLTENAAFAEIQESWQTTGNTQELAAYLEENILTRDQSVQDILVVQNDEIVLSINEIYDYSFEEISGNDEVGFCKRNNHLQSLAISRETETEVRYVVLVNLEKIYEAVSREKLQVPDDVFLIDKGNRFLLHSHRGDIFIGDVKQGKEDMQDKECIDTLVTANKEREQRRILAYKQYDPRTEEEETNFVFSLPAEDTKNGIFAIGVSIVFGDTIRSIQKLTFLVLGSGLLLVTGIAFFVSAALKTWRNAKKRKQEIEALHEKNAEMEKKNQELQELAHHQRLETIGVLTSGIAHEFNNLLTPIMGYSMMTLEQMPEEDEELYDNVLEIYNASRKAKDVISRLSDLSRKRDTIAYNQVSIDEIVDKVLNVVKSAQPKTVSVEKRLNCRGQQILGNETLLMQMILNLVLNAFQAMEESGGLMEISTENKDEMLLISVKDTGIGMPEETQAKMFEPFFTTKDSTKGTGLGLAIVQQVVEAHHGKIEVISKEGEGCIFNVYLPGNM